MGRHGRKRSANQAVHRDVAVIFEVNYDRLVDVVRGEGLAQTRKEYYSDSDSASEEHTSGGIPTADSDQSVNQRWPSTLALGYDADRDIREKCMDVLRVLDEWRDVACSISYDD